MWKKMVSYKWTWWILLCVILFLPTLSLFQGGLPLTHDGQDHVARIANFYKNLQEGIIIPRWAGNLNWGYGHPILMFLYPLPSYMASLFHFLGFSFIDSTKLVFGVSYILSGLTMYLWLKTFLGKKAAFVGSILYAFAPYRFIDLYLRGAIGEHVAFIFPPLVFYFLTQLNKKQALGYISWGGVCLGALILAHNAISIMFLPLFLLYGIYLFMNTSAKKLFTISFIGILGIGFSLSAFFWLPATIEGKYTLRDIVLKGQYDSPERFLPFSKFIYSPWSFGTSGQFSVQLGLVAWLIILSSAFLLIRNKRLPKERKGWIGFLLIAIMGSIWFMTPSATFIWSAIPLIQQFQFPWRFLSVSIFLAALLGAFFVDSISSKWQTYFLIAISAGTVLFTFPYWHARAYIQKPDTFFSGVYKGTTDTGESAPIWSVRFMESAPSSHMNIIGGQAQVRELSRSSTRHTYDVVASGDAQLRENTLFFPNWEVFVDGGKVPVEFQDINNRGVMTFHVPSGKHTVLLTFTPTRLRKIAELLSLCTIFALIISGILKKIHLWPNFL